MAELAEKIEALMAKKEHALQRLEVPARAAVNALIDANMKRTADPLAQVLFELDALHSEMQKLIQTATPEEGRLAIIELLRKTRP
jgi:Spy/CpxP family protein refolding chaperone